MTNNNTGMFDCRQIHSYLMISNGKHLFASRIGNKKVSIVQENGSTLYLILHDCMYIPDMYINLFSINKALGEGWKLSNHGLQMILSRSDKNITFDQVLKTAYGSVCGVKMLPSYDSGGIELEESANDRCSSPFAGYPTSSDLHDKTFICCDLQCVQSKISFENLFSIL